MKPIVIVGSGLAGYSVARELRKLAPSVQIIVVTEDGGEFYAKPMLSNALALRKLPANLASATAQQIAADFSLEVLTGVSVTGIDPAKRTLQLGNQGLEYEHLVLAVGGQPIRLKMAGDAADRVLSVNRLDHYRAFREHIERHRRIAILGAGLVGCEFANDLAAASHPIDVIDVAPHALSRFWPQPLAEDFEARLHAVGVRWQLDRKVERIDTAPDGDGLLLRSADGKTLRVDTVLSAVGVDAEITLANVAGLKVNRGIVVDRWLQTSDKHIYALGDCAEVEGLLLPFIIPIMHAARALARTLSGARTPVVYPAMPVVLKTPACPAVFFPATTSGSGQWHIEREVQGMRAFYRNADGLLLAAALSGACTRDKDAVLKQLPALLPAALPVPA